MFCSKQWPCFWSLLIKLNLLIEFESILIKMSLLNIGVSNVAWTTGGFTLDWFLIVSYETFKFL